MLKRPQNTPLAGLTSLLVIVALIATACGNGSSTDTAATTTSDAPSAVAFEDSGISTTTAQQFDVVSVAARNSIETSPLWIADSRGLFAKYGIEIKYVPVSDEGAVVGSMISDEARIGMLSATAVVDGLRSLPSDLFEPLVYVSGTDIRAESGRGAMSLVAASGRTISSGCDLVGQSVAVRGFITAPAIAVREMVRNDGCDPAEVTLVASNAEQTITRLGQGQVAAAATLDPLTAQALRNSNTVIANLDAELCPGYGVCPLSIAVVDIDWATNNPELAEGFRRAMHEAISWIRVNEIDYRAELVKCCSVDVDDATESDIPNFIGVGRSLDSDLARLQDVVSAQLEARRASTALSDAAPDEPSPDASAETDAEAGTEGS